MQDKNALIIGIRDEESICYAIAKEIKRSGYNLYATYQDETTYNAVKRIADEMAIREIFKYDARKDEDLVSFTEAFKQRGIGLDFVVHGISYSTAQEAKLGVPLIDLTWEQFTDAIRVGAFSLAEVSGRLLEVINEDGSILAVTLRWSRRAVPNFNVVCCAKAALESIIRGLAQSLGEANRIRVNGISPGFVPTYSLSKVGNSLEILEREKSRSPLKVNVRKEDIGALAVSILENRSVTAMIYPIDAGVECVET